MTTAGGIIGCITDGIIPVGAIPIGIPVGAIPIGITVGAIAIGTPELLELLELLLLRGGIITGPDGCIIPPVGTIPIGTPVGAIPIGIPVGAIPIRIPEGAIPIGAPDGVIPTRIPELLELLLLRGILITGV
jgi:hypothetical protein